MSEEDFDIAHETLERTQDDIVNLVFANIHKLNEDQKQYVITKLSDEFRFWRALK